MTDNKDTAHQLYFMFRMLLRGQQIPIAVWNGINDYENHPPNNVLAGLLTAPNQRLGIVQIGKPVGTKRRRSITDRYINTYEFFNDTGVSPKIETQLPIAFAALEMIMVNMLPFDVIVLWARNQKTYQSIVKDLKAHAVNSGPIARTP